MAATTRLRLTAVRVLSPDTKIFRFVLSEPAVGLSIPCGHHIALIATVPTPEHPEGERIKRKYTPLSHGDQREYCDLLIKVYYSCPQFPLGGLLTQYIDRMQIGQEVDFAGPRGKVTYHGDGRFTLVKLGNREVTVQNVAMIAGGSGIAPMYQVLRYITSHNEPISVSLLFANRTESDIVLRSELESMVVSHNLRLWLTLDRPPSEWTQGRGYITREMLQEHLPPPSPSTLVLFSGPSPMNRSLRVLLTDLGYDPIVKF